METNDIIPAVNETDAAREKFEQERMNRRAALRKLGLTTGFALFGMFAVDDLARVAVKKLAEHKETKAIADSIAHDFKNMGVAFADDGDDGGYYDAGPCPAILISTSSAQCKNGRWLKNISFKKCSHCFTQDNADNKAALDNYTACYGEHISAGFSSTDADTACAPAYNAAINNAFSNCNDCVSAHCPEGTVCVEPPRK